MQQLVDQGVTIGNAAEIVALTYPQTAGDTFYRSTGPHDTLGYSVGVYGLWNALRGDQSPMGGTKVSDDARTIAQFLRLNGGKLSEVVDMAGRRDLAVTTVVDRTARAMRAGDYFEPVAIEPENPMPGIVADLQRSVARLDGIGDYIRDIPLPRFGG